MEKATLLGSSARIVPSHSREDSQASSIPLPRDSGTETAVEPRRPPSTSSDTQSSPNELTGSRVQSTTELGSHTPDGVKLSSATNVFQPSQTESDSGTRKLPSINSKTEHLHDVQYGSADLLSPWFLEVDPNNERARTWRTWHSRQDVLLATATGISAFVFLLNFIATIVTQVKYKLNKGVVAMYEGSCSWVKRTDTILHILINLLSSLLLGASNLCMQILAAPTRKETDEAHRKKRWLDIGVPSWRNLRSIGRARLGVWCCLGLSSVPLHFVYNSAISISIPRYSYAAAVVSENFLHNATWVLPGQPFPWSEYLAYSGTWDGYSALVNLSNVALDNSKVKNLTTIECLRTYADAYGDRTDMLMVTQDDSTSKNGSLIEYAYLPATRYEAEKEANFLLWSSSSLR